MSRYQVRCCCDCTKILGTVEADKPILYQKTKFPVGASARQEYIELEFGEVFQFWNIITKAFKSHNLPLERLRQIASFKELA